MNKQNIIWTVFALPVFIWAILVGPNYKERQDNRTMEIYNIQSEYVSFYDKIYNANNPVAILQRKLSSTENQIERLKNRIEENREKLRLGYTGGRNRRDYEELINVNISRDSRVLNSKIKEYNDLEREIAQAKYHREDTINNLKRDKQNYFSKYNYEITLNDPVKNEYYFIVMFFAYTITITGLILIMNCPPFKYAVLLILAVGGAGYITRKRNVA